MNQQEIHKHFEAWQQAELKRLNQLREANKEIGRLRLEIDRLKNSDTRASNDG